MSVKTKKKCYRQCCTMRCIYTPEEYEKTSFHKFPLNINKRQAWIDATKIPDWVPTVSSKLCSRHFDPKYFDINGSQKKYLRMEAVPTIFENHSENFLKLISRSYKRGNASQASSKKNSIKTEIIPKEEKPSLITEDNEGQ